MRKITKKEKFVCLLFVEILTRLGRHCIKCNQVARAICVQPHKLHQQVKYRDDRHYCLAFSPSLSTMAIYIRSVSRGRTSISRFLRDCSKLPTLLYGSIIGLACSYAAINPKTLQKRDWLQMGCRYLDELPGFIGP